MRKTSEQEVEEQKGPINIDEQVIPTMNSNKGKSSMPQEYENENEEGKDAEELTGDKII